MRAWIISAILLAVAPLSWAAERVTRIPLNDGHLHVGDLNATLFLQWGLPACNVGGDIDLKSPLGADFLLAVNGCLTNGWSIATAGSGTLLVRTDDAGLPGRCEAAWRAVRLCAAESSPHATACQARSWGLLLPQTLDPKRPLVVLIHGLEADRGDCMPMGELLRQGGYQVAYFSYPGDQPIADDARLLASQLRSLLAAHPNLSIDIIAHSMGGLVARAYVEGSDYSGGVNRLIMIGTPNHGSSWAPFHSLLAMQQHYRLYHDEPNWHWTWIITEGLGEAGCDLRPGSTFLRELNARPRRPGVKYTNIAGSRTAVRHAESSCVRTVANWMPRRVRSWWGFRQCYDGLCRRADRWNAQTGSSDGPVSIRSVELDGVRDMVILPADHLSLFMPAQQPCPAAWPVVRDRLAS